MDPVSASIIITSIGWLAKPLYKKAVDIAYQKFTKRVGLQEETDNLIAELKSFKVPKETAETTNYLQEVKELVRQATDLLDELDYFRLQDEVEQMNRAENGNTFTKFKSSDVPSSSTGVTFKQLKFDKRGMSSRMKDLCKKLKCYTCQSKNTHVEHELLSKIVERIEKENNSALPTNRQTDSFFPEVQIFGRDAEIKQIQKLIHHIEKHPQELSVIAIVGQGGVGKTTVAQEVYRKLTPSFGTKMWVCVSSDFDEREITCQMLEYCYNVRYDRNSNKNFLKTKLQEYLKEKKFLLVLDDIWEMSETEWKSLLAPLNVHTTSNNTGSMVLVTTRYPFIANMVSTIDPIYLDKLDDGSFWSFFLKCAFGDARYNVPAVLEAIGRKIVEKLSGNPLAAKTVGNLLKGENDPTKWSEILNSGEWKFVEAKDGIMPTLRLSYEYLPLHLKQCFSYCSLFPKDHYFKADDLVYMWMAHNFINENNEIVKNFPQKNKKRVEDVGFEYLNILVERAFFQQIVTDWGQVVYVMHDLMHDLAQVVSSENFLAINHGEPTPMPPHLCHLSFLLEVRYTIENHVQLQELSSLVIFENNKVIKSALNWDQAIRVCLRLLILPYMRAISYNFSHFTHLRYLKLNVYSNDNEKAEFPVQICRLYHLQVLELEDSYVTVNELPKHFNNLVNLRHFIAHDCLHSKIAGVGRLKHLQELKRFVVRGEKDFGIGQLSKLKELKRSLQICSLQNVKNKEDAECARLSEKEIVKLKLHWDEETKDKPRQNSVSRGEIGGKQRRRRQKQNRGGIIRDASSEEILEALRPNNDLRDIYIENYGGCISPTWLTDHSIKYLESIHLSNCQAWEELPNFGQLMCLKVLYLWNLPRVKAFRPQFHGSGPQEGFPSLKLMDVRSMFELKTWVWSPCNTFPSLEKLYISGCPNLIEFSLLELIPIHGEKAQWFSKLEYLNITNCPKLQQGGFGGVHCLTLKAELEIHRIEDPKVLAFMIRVLKNIGSITINDCPNFTSLSWKCICMLHSLKRLQFERCHGLCFSLVVEEEKDDGSTFYSHESLQELKIHECSVTGDELSYLMAHLPAIRQLSIKKCYGIDFVSLPSINNEPNRASMDAGVRIGQDEQQRPKSLMCLEELYIDDCPDMAFVNGGSLSRLTALKKVAIGGSDKLLCSMNQKERSNSVQTLRLVASNIIYLKLYSFVALSNLILLDCKDLAAVECPNSIIRPVVFIDNCPRLAETQSPIEPKFLIPAGKLNIDNFKFISVHPNISMSLHSLTIRGVGSQRDWKEWTEEQENVVINHLPALMELVLSHCFHLRSLPSTLYLHLSLKELTIVNCPQITSLPEKGFPKSLQRLCLSKNCNEQLESQCSQKKDFECSEETGEDGLEYQVFLKRDQLTA